MKIVGYQIFFTDYEIRHLGNPSGLPEILLKIDPCHLTIRKDRIIVASTCRRSAQFCCYVT